MEYAPGDRIPLGRSQEGRASNPKVSFVSRVCCRDLITRVWLRATELGGLSEVRRRQETGNGKRSITADTALRLQRYSGVEAQFWLNLQTEYDLRMMKRKVWADIERRIIPIKGAGERTPQSAEA